MNLIVPEYSALSRNLQGALICGDRGRAHQLNSHFAAKRSKVEKRDLTRLLGWPGYRVYQYELDEAAKKLKLWVRKKPIHGGFVCSGCGRRVHTVIAMGARGGRSELLRVPDHGSAGS